MKAAFMTGVDMVEIRPAPEPELDPEGTVLRVEACGICGTDARTFFNGDPRAPAPWILGHEPVGVLEEVGPRAVLPPGIKKGDRVFLGSILTCGRCRYCMEGLQNLCDEHLLYGYDPYPGAYAEYAAVPPIAVKNLIPLPADLPSDLATVADPVACALNGNTGASGVLRGVAEARPGGGARHEPAPLHGARHPGRVRRHAPPVPDHDGLPRAAPRRARLGRHPPVSPRADR